MKNIRMAVILAGIFLAFSAYPGQDIDGRFYEANTFYRNGESDKAIELYENIILNGEKSAALFYNLGNAYLKNGNIGRAVLNFERAKIAIPGDSALLFNLAHARDKMKQQDISFRANACEAFLINSAGGISFKENIIFIFILFSTFLILVVVGLYMKKIRTLVLFVALISLTMAALSCIPACHKHYVNCHSAFIVEPITDARYEPDDNSGSHFPLYEGNRVFVLREAGNWIKVKRPDERIGWIKKNAAVKLRI